MARLIYEGPNVMPFSLPAPGSREDQEVTKLFAYVAAKLDQLDSQARDDGDNDLALIIRDELTSTLQFLEAWTHRDDNSPSTGQRAREGNV